MQHRKLGRYELVRVLGKGAMGVVYEGRDPNLDRRVAIKTIMVDDLSPDAAAEYEARFQVEARSAARLQHPNIVTVYDSARDGDTAFLVMEFIEGDDLKQHLDRGRSYDTQQALRLVVDLLAALDYAHRQGVVHRDVKPANLLIEASGQLKLTDFGVARITGEATRTQGSMIGTLKYMAPEQVQGQKTDGRADLFSAAVVAYHLLTGVRPFDGDNDFTIIHQIIGHTPAAPSSILPALPGAVDAVFERALAKSRDDRFQTGADFSMALRRSLQDVVADGPDTPTVPGTAPGLPRRSDTRPGVGHELELEYWRAVRDSVDVSDLQGFLARFPEGIYADLAQRRLERLTGRGDPERTVMQGGTSPSAPRPTATPTVEPTATLPMPRESGEDTAKQAILAPDGTPATAVASAATASAVGAPVPVRRVTPADDDTSVPPRPKAKPPYLWIGGGAVAVFAAIALLLGRGHAPAPMEAPAAPVAATPAPAPAPSPRAAAPVATAPVASPAPAEAAATKAPEPAAVAARAEQPVAKPKPSTPATTPKSPSHAETVAAAPHERLVPPSVTCKDKVFVAKQFCLYNECQKPVYQNFPACVQLREEARLREAGRIGN